MWTLHNKETIGVGMYYIRFYPIIGVMSLLRSEPTHATNTSKKNVDVIGGVGLKMELCQQQKRWAARMPAARPAGAGTGWVLRH
jgi:hypothetical protein